MHANKRRNDSWHTRVCCLKYLRLIESNFCNAGHAACGKYVGARLMYRQDAKQARTSANSSSSLSSLFKRARFQRLRHFSSINCLTLILTIARGNERRREGGKEANVFTSSRWFHNKYWRGLPPTWQWRAGIALTQAPLRDRISSP